MSKSRKPEPLPEMQYGMFGWCSTNDHANCHKKLSIVTCICECHKEEHESQAIEADT